MCVTRRGVVINTTVEAPNEEIHGAITDSVVRTLTDSALELARHDLPPETLHATKRCLLDAIGCAANASGSTLSSALLRLAGTTSSPTPASIIGSPVKTSPEMAGFVNGSLIRCLDYNDDYFGTAASRAKGDTGPHPSDNIGSVLATAEMVGASGADTLLAIVTAYEVCGRLVDEVILRANGWDHPILHSISTSVAAGTLMQLDRAALANAIRLAVVPNICLYETRFGAISNWKGLAGPNGSKNGLFAAQLAKVGITGPEMAFEGQRGYMRQLEHSFAIPPFGGPANDFRINHTYFKQRPLRYEMQLPVQMAIELRDRVDPSTIQNMRVFMEGKSVTARELEPELWRPTSRETADHSGPYLIAAALVDGEIAEDSFDRARFADPDLQAIMDAIELVEDSAYTDAFLGRMSCRFELELHDGSSLTHLGHHPRGHPDNPMTDGELETKFLAQVQPKYGDEIAQRVMNMIWNFDEETTLGRFFELVS